MNTLKVEKLNQHIGIEIQGLDDITKLDATIVQEIKQLILTYGFVVIKGIRKWSEQEQMAFTEKLGTLELPVVYSIPPTQIIGKNIKTRVERGSGVFWHSDNSYQECPSHLSVFQMIEIPESGTSTSFASLINLSRNLPKMDKSLWRDYSVVYRDAAVHPILWKHPFNGKDTVYFDIGFSTDILNHCDNGNKIPMKESNQIFNYINERLSDEESLIKHQWREGDIIILDNYAVAHRADTLLDNENRVLLRMTTKGIYF
ncbi:TauD/TfdA family dioxygenase [uncultured Aquimarina sp.]|uniref:TauD/TfdA dioxygenase family protein n=1 Tax=uncultured Aquimarina sp. TaxID=575652 RepID=UPI002630E28A|nr:TauD/TfdA family dioxygenase [uncultured Aquimarina sp.]